MNTPKVITLVILFYFCFNRITAQITIDGTITDSDSNPISNALVEIIDQNDTSNNYDIPQMNLVTLLYQTSPIFEVEKRTYLQNLLFLEIIPIPLILQQLFIMNYPKQKTLKLRSMIFLAEKFEHFTMDFHKAGTYTLNWDGRNGWNSPVAAGIYFCRIKTKDQFKVHKMVLLDGGSTSSSVSNNTN